jgi:competence protein ComEA
VPYTTASDTTATDDDAAVLPRPTPRRTPGAHVRDRARAWVVWFGFGRLVGGAIATAVVVGGAWWLVRSPPVPTEATLPVAAGATTGGTPGTAPSSPPAASVPTAGTTITTSGSVLVHVAGAVANPGVHELASGARVVDVIAAAGGALADADPDALNLAAVVTDAARVYVPRVGEVVPATAPPALPGGTSAPAAPVDLNSAGVAELDDLPGVGPATAAAIVAHRDRTGPFASVDDLLDVRGIGPAKLEAIRALVTV